MDYLLPILFVLTSTEAESIVVEPLYGLRRCYVKRKQIGKALVCPSHELKFSTSVFDL
jgi:hypothetical protein